MKTKTISMMLIGMMMLGTTTSFGKTTIVKKQNTHVTVIKKQTPDKKCKVTKKGQKCTCRTCKPQPVKTQNHSGGKHMKKKYTKA